jgi:hypothetical protein
MRNLATLDIIGCNYSAPVIPFSSASGVVVINSNNNGNGGGDSGESSLYLMVSNEYDPMERLDKSDFPVFSIRHLATHARATIPTSTNTKPPQQQQQHQTHAMFQSKYPIESMNYDQNIFGPEFHMRVIYSFKHNGFVYFLFTITNKMLSESCNRIDDIDTTMIMSSSLNQTSSANNNNNINGGGSKIVTRMLRICDTKYNAFSRTNRESTMFNSGEAVIDHIQSLYTGGGAASNSATLTETVIECEDGSSGKLDLIIKKL